MEVECRHSVAVTAECRRYESSRSGTSCRRRNVRRGETANRATGQQHEVVEMVVSVGHEINEGCLIGAGREGV